MTVEARLAGLAALLFAWRLCAGAELAVDPPLYVPSVALERFDASVGPADGRVHVRWQTTRELGVQAFLLLRHRVGEAPSPVGNAYVMSPGDEAGSVYDVIDEQVRPGDAVRYELFLVLSSRGPDQRLAEWSGRLVHAEDQWWIPRAQPDVAVAATPTAPLRVPAQAWIGAGARIRSWTNDVPADRVRLSLREEGVYRVSGQELADASGWGAAAITNAINSGGLSLSCRGEPVAWEPDQDGMLFYGRPAESRFAPENVYWLAWGAGTNMEHRTVNPAMPARTNAWFMDSLVRQGTDYLARVSYSALADSPAPYIAFSPGPLKAGSRRSFSDALPDCATGSWTGTVTVNLLSYYEVGTDDHAARVSIGGTVVGEPAWSGEQYVSVTYPFASTNTEGGLVELLVENTATAPALPETDYTRFICVSYAIGYAREYRANADDLLFTGGSGNTVAVNGFATNDIMLLDVTATNAPVIVAPLTLTHDDTGLTWTASFPCEGTNGVYRVFSRSRAVRHPSVRGIRDVDWSSSSNACDYAILIPPEGWRDDFRAVLQPLADFRGARGLRTRIIDVESLYDCYSDGIVDPSAIHQFCRDGVTNWTGRPLRYLLLAGAGAIDYRHQRLTVNDYSACLIPTVILGQTFPSGEGMTVAADGEYADVDGDGAPDLAIGRLPTTSAAAMASFVDKTLAWETTTLWNQPVSLAADWNNVGSRYYPFGVGTDRLVEPLVRTGRRVVKHYPIDDTGNLLPVKINSLLPALSAGAGLFHFFGHTDEQNLGGGSGKLLRMSDISTANWRQPVVAVVVGCRPNRWHSLTATVCILPYGLFAGDTGFPAAMGATGYMLGNEGEDLAVAFYETAATPGDWRLGDVWRSGLTREAGVVPPERLTCFSLIGDPALTFCRSPFPPGTTLIVR